MWALEAAKLEAKRLLSYRVDFWLYFVAHCVTEITIAYFLWSALYSLSPDNLFGGFTFREMLNYYIFVPFVDRMVRSSDDFSTSREIYEGGLNKFLVFPISFMTYKLLQKSTYTVLASFQMFLALIIIIPFFDLSLTPMQYVLGILSSMVSFLLYTHMGFIFEFMAFWADAVWGLGVMMRFITLFLGGSMIPLALFPHWAQTVLSFTPFPYLFSYPIQTFLGRISLEQTFFGIGIALVWTLAFWMLSSLIFKKGLKSYTGVGI